MNSETSNKLQPLQYARSFALNAYYGIRQWFLQIILLEILDNIAILLGAEISYGRFGFEGAIIVACTLLYTMLFYCSRTFTQHLRPLQQVIIPYIPYALMVYLEIVSINDWNFKRVTLDYYMLEGLLMPLYSLFVIWLGDRVKRLLPNNKVKRVLNIVWNVLTILIAPLIAILTIGIFIWCGKFYYLEKHIRLWNSYYLSLSTSSALLRVAISESRIILHQRLRQ